MKTRIEIKKEIAQTIDDASKILLFLQSKLDEKDSKGYSFHMDYQKWYSKALRIVDMFGKDRLNDFKSHYEIDPRRKLLGYGTYTIQDYLKVVEPNSIRFPGFDALNSTLTNFYNQYTILGSIYERFDSALAEIQTTLLHEIQKTELSSARTLLKVNLRSSGVLSGVILETHLGNIVLNHGIKIAKKNPTLSDFNETLKSNNIIDTTSWKKILYLSDIRNLCAHKKDREPILQEVEELIEGVNWALKNLY